MPSDPLWINCPSPGAAPQYTAAELRQAMALGGVWGGRDLGARQGVRPGGTQWQVSLAGATLTVNPGVGLVDPGLTTPQGPYWVALPAAETHTLTPAHATSPRKDILVVRVYDTDEDASGLREARSEYVAGVPAPSPAEPAVPTGAVKVALVDVPAQGGGNPAVTQAAPFIAAPGGVLLFRSATDQAAAVTHEGQVAYRLDTDRMVVWNGAAWVALATVGGSAGPLVEAPAKAAASARLHWGVVTASTDASGYLTVTHGAPFTPAGVIVFGLSPTGGSADIPIGIVADTFTATTFKARLWNQSGVNIASSSVTLAYLLWPA
jgi:hypothetical protein